MSVRFRFLVGVLAVLGVANPARAGILAEWSEPGGNGHSYELIEQTLHWSDAKTTAEAMTRFGLNGYLLSITSQSENDFVFNAFGGLGIHAAWMGLTDNETYFGQESGGPSNPAAPFWVWLTGEPVVYTNWIPGEPNNLFGDDFGEIVLDAGGVWNDLPDFEPHLRTHYIVEYDAVSQVEPVPEPSSIVLLGIGSATLGFIRGRRKGQNRD